LKAVRDEMIRGGNVRTSINRMIGRIKRAFRWAVEQEYIDAAVWQSLSAVAGLRRGRSDAQESEPVRPVPVEWIDAIEAHVSRRVWAMVPVMLHSGARPGEVVTMRGCDLTTTGRVWEFRPEAHKTEHHGRGRTVYLVPKAQAVVREFLKPDIAAHLFSSADGRAEYLAKRRAERKTPMTPLQAARQRKSNPAKQPGERYTVCSLGQAVAKGIAKANREREREGLAAIPLWHLHQLRHNAATTIRREAGLDVSKAVLGHATISATQLYAEQDAAAAAAIMARIG
jgi:integrase